MRNPKMLSGIALLLIIAAWMSGCGGTTSPAPAPAAVSVQMGGAKQGVALVLTGITTTAAGSAGAAGSADGTGGAARFSHPYGVATDGINLYIADAANSTIRKMVIATGAVSTIAGSPGMAGSSDGTGTAARFNVPYGITTDGSSLFIADTGNSTIRKLSLATGRVTTIAGSAGVMGFNDGTGQAALFNAPFDITTDGKFLFVVDNSTVRKIDPTTGAVTTIAGAPGQTGTADGPGYAARFCYPGGITTDGSSLYVSDTGNCTIRRVVTGTGTVTVTTIAGSARTIGSADGRGTAARFDAPNGITTDGTYIFLSDTLNRTVRRIEIASSDVTTVAGSPGQIGSTDEAGPQARFNQPYGITTDGLRLFLGDCFNNVIRTIW